jgi:HAD superfamily hydrolase (TIGR01490 family)
VAGFDFFDVDHTVTRRSSGARFVSVAVRRGVVPRRVLFAMPWYSFTYRLGMFRIKDYKAGFPYLRGISRSTMNQIAAESFEKLLRTDIYRGAESLIRQQKEKGRRVALASSSLDLIIMPLARFLGIETVIATSLEFDGDKSTGRVEGVPVFRREKKRRVLEFLAAQGEDPRECSFYTDSIFDMPLLEAVGQPVVVNPDFRLRKAARRKRWPIMSFS